ncbi:hypothetical protein L2K70_00960 [Nocardioides KLBMP 9356]|uniref:PPE domain-containing protein n=1 Tax=Nocardioides potassii TaxID=2911371 RepID=A0ABS9H4I3_9ACTN|nr:hypothetical protein [Nocardioides potassii]MCF6376170.1 hypothetical protein [Nocardioides potassii]
MPANPFELRADVRPLDAAAARWAEIGELMARRGDELVEAARRATEGWDAEAAESYEQHRRQVLVNLDRFTALALQVSASLRAISSVLTTSQEELDRSWEKVALVPHEVVGESRHLVFKPDDDDGRGKVTSSQAETDEIRGRLRLSLDEESARLRTACAELVTVRTELSTLTGGVFGRRIGPGVGPGFGPGGEESGVGTVLPSTSVTSVPGAAQSGLSAAGLPPVAPISVDMPHLTGLSAAALAPFVASAAAGAAGRAGARRAAGATTPAAGGMGMGAMGARAGTMSGGAAGGRAGARRLAAPRLEGEDDADAAAQARQGEKDAKRAALEEKRAARAARKAEREAERNGRSDTAPGTGKKDAKGKKDEDDERAPRETEESHDADDSSDSGDSGGRPAAITVVTYEPGEEPATDGAPAAGPDGADAGGVEDVRRS